MEPNLVTRFPQSTGPIWNVNKKGTATICTTFAGLVDVAIRRGCASVLRRAICMGHRMGCGAKTLERFVRVQRERHVHSAVQLWAALRRLRFEPIGEVLRLQGHAGRHDVSSILRACRVTDGGVVVLPKPAATSAVRGVSGGSLSTSNRQRGRLSA